VLVSTEGRLYPLIGDRMRPKDRRHDQIGRAAVQLREWADVPARQTARERRLSA
jgi:hypothetical protein